MADSVSLINYHIEELKDLENLSERTKNVCIEDSLDTLFKLIQYYQRNKSFLSIRNCGLKTNKELIGVAEKYIRLYNIGKSDLELSSDARKFETLRFYCYTKFTIPSTKMEPYKDEFLHKSFPFFRFISLIIEHLLNERERYIFERNFGFLDSSKKLTLQSIGDKYGITRERVRQIAQKIPQKLEKALSSFAGEYEGYFTYSFKVRRDLLLIDASAAETMNQKESLNFSPKFYAFAFGILQRKNLYGFQDIEQVNKNYFLVNNKYQPLFDFQAFFDDLTQRTVTRIEQTYSIDFEEYLKRFELQPLEIEVKEKLKYICKKIITLEFKVPIERNQLLFIRNTLIKLSEYITDILVTAGKPMRLVDIARELRIKSPKMPPNLESLRSTILSIPNVSAIGKTSTYSLDQWNNVKTGTIKEIVKEYLNIQNKPMHITDITNYVNQFRKTSDKNIYSNLKLDKNRSFMFFKKGFIGLSDKTYGHQDKNGQLSML
ncbi:MAG: sigma factor-like helix-turn-helix DNA-binding protein [Bacteroidota bacterium]|nr:sigma factor-like helix-turn-helix DNA-binding protein [Bacteroidota bacterium]